MNMRGIKYIGILCICFISMQALSQNGNGLTKKEQKQAQRVAFLTQKLALTPAEAEVFWPVYREYQQARITLRKTSKPSKKGKVAELSDAELEKLLDDMIAYKQKELDLKKMYHEKFKAILPIKKVAKLYHAEEQFNKNRRQYQSQKPGNKAVPKGPSPTN